VFELGSGHAATRGATGLERPDREPSEHRPPSSCTIVARLVPIGTSSSPPKRTCPVSENTLVPLLLVVPIRAYQSEPSRRIGTTLAKFRTVVDSRWAGRPPPAAAVGRPWSGGGRALAFDRVDQGRCLSADIGPSPDPQNSP